MLANKTFYPTPASIVQKMVYKIKGHPKKVLDPEAGKGDLVDGVANRWKHSHGHSPDISAIEIDPNLQATLRGKGIKLIDTDFLAYTGPDKFDLIIMNPPFDDGDKHLLKALDIMYRGQIICLLNAETLRNPFTNDRKLLVRRLEEAGTEIEYIKNAFISAERKTDVEVALVNVVIDRKVEDDLFADCDDHGTRAYQAVEDKHELSTGKTVDELVAEYNSVIQAGTETIVGYFRNYRKIAKHIGLNREAKENDYSNTDLTEKMQAAVNDLLKSVRTDFWRRTLDLKEVRSRLTKKKQAEFEHNLADRCHMDFTVNNVLQFALNVINNSEKTLVEAVLDLFDMFTIRHTWDENNLHEKNIHFYNGWKTNKAFKVGKRVVIPVRTGSYGSPFLGFRGWALNYGAEAFLDDIDKVMSYFDGGKPYLSISEALKNAFARGESSAIESTYFKSTCHKKGTIHLTFLNEDILRRFNVIACRGKGWLPGDFGAKPYNQLTFEERAVVNSFEGEKSYEQNRSTPLLGTTSLLCLPGAAPMTLSDMNEADEFRTAA